jgi:hypothetical protein
MDLLTDHNRETILEFPFFAALVLAAAIVLFWPAPPAMAQSDDGNAILSTYAAPSGDTSLDSSLDSAPPGPDSGAPPADADAVAPVAAPPSDATARPSDVIAPAIGPAAGTSPDSDASATPPDVPPDSPDDAAGQVLEIPQEIDPSIPVEADAGSADDPDAQAPDQLGNVSDYQNQSAMEDAGAIPGNVPVATFVAPIVPRGPVFYGTGPVLPMSPVIVRPGGLGPFMVTSPMLSFPRHGGAMLGGWWTRAHR